MKGILRAGLLLALGAGLAACPEGPDPDDLDLPPPKTQVSEPEPQLETSVTSTETRVETPTGATSMRRTEFTQLSRPAGKSSARTLRKGVAAGDASAGKLQAELRQASPDLSTFGQLLALAGEQDLLDRRDKTLLAPTDQAFRALPAGQLAALRADKPALERLIRNHLIDKRVPLSEFASMMGGASTSFGELLTVTKTPDQHIYLQEARVLSQDRQAGHLLVHVVDRVLLPLSPAS